MSNEVSEPEIYHCTDCGAEVNENAKVCPKCGSNFDVEKKEIKTSESKSSIGSKVIGIITTFIVIAVV